MDDPRNTDNAWMETVVLHFHDETREILGDIEFEVCKEPAWLGNAHIMIVHIYRYRADRFSTASGKYEGIR